MSVRYEAVVSRFHCLGLVATFLLLVACGGGATPTTRFCDVVYRVEATADPLTRPEVFATPALLEAALNLRVNAYTDLSNVAPAEVQSDVLTVRNGIVAVTQELRAAGFVSEAANSPSVAALVKNSQLTTAQASLRRFTQKACAPNVSQ